MHDDYRKSRHLRDARGYCRARDALLQWENEQPVEENVQRGADDGGGHDEHRRAVVAAKALKSG